MNYSLKRRKRSYNNKVVDHFILYGMPQVGGVTAEAPYRDMLFYCSKRRLGATKNVRNMSYRMFEYNNVLCLEMRLIRARTSPGTGSGNPGKTYWFNIHGVEIAKPKIVPILDDECHRGWSPFK